MVSIVKDLCKPFQGTHCTVFLDRFFTSVDMYMALSEMDLYCTRTVMANKILKQLQIKKSLKEFKEMKRGDYKCHLYKGMNGKGNSIKIGLTF